MLFWTGKHTMNNYKIMAGLLGLALTAVAARAAAPSLSYKINGNEFIITYTGTLYQSSDAVNWTEVASASSPYKVTLGDKKLFFCAKGESDTDTKNITIPLSDTVDLDMIWIDPGTFMMGSPEDELGRDDDETQHQVTLTSGYWLGKYEVTQAQYKAVMGENPSEFVGDNNPVENVNWNDAANFCAKLTEIEKAAGRLPEGYEYTL
ncbi:MAG: formylglycine-generating enzyme family protein, partial [Verrucomicrobia bacterium]|nr:formylglycine-generating enzyme family protein [Verrucomicrobiota bacterium]